MKISSRIVRTGALAATLFALAAPGAVLAHSEASDITVEPPATSRWHIGVSAWLDRADATYEAGDTVTLWVKTTKPAYITVLDIGTSGRVHVVFPNRYQRNNWVGAFETVRIPSRSERFRLRVGGPSGEEVLKVIATDRPIECLDVRHLALSGDFYALPGDVNSISRDINVELRHRAHYSVATRVLQVVAGYRRWRIPHEPEYGYYPEPREEGYRPEPSEREHGYYPEPREERYSYRPEPIEHEHGYRPEPGEGKYGRHPEPGEGYGHHHPEPGEGEYGHHHPEPGEGLARRASFEDEFRRHPASHEEEHGSRKVDDEFRR
jgi:hypothetical protein